VVSKPGLAPDGRGVFLQILQLPGWLSRFRNALQCSPRNNEQGRAGRFQCFSNPKGSQSSDHAMTLNPKFGEKYSPWMV
jgi:hypothetical protein